MNEKSMDEAETRHTTTLPILNNEIGYVETDSRKA